MGRWRTLIGLILSGLGVVFSFSSVVFFVYGNYQAAIWALISGIFAGIDLHLYMLNWRRTLANWHDLSTIKDLEILAVAGMVFGIGFAGWYIFTFIYYSLPIFPINESYQIASVWAFMAAKYSFALLLTVRHLATELQNNYPNLLVSSPSYQRNQSYYKRVGVVHE